MTDNRRSFLKKLGGLSGAGLLATTPVLAATEQWEKNKNDIHQEGDEPFNIAILQTTDVHCQVHAHDELFWENNQAIYRKTGGYAQLSTYLKEFRKKKTVGIRIPDNNIALEIVRMLGNPIVSTSTHDEDEVLEYSTDPELIFEKWQNQVDLVIDGGYGDNVGSTIIDLSGYEPIVVREGKGDPDIL
jgi:hypothetical protein